MEVASFSKLTFIHFHKMSVGDVVLIYEDFIRIHSLYFTLSTTIKVVWLIETPFKIFYIFPLHV